MKLILENWRKYNDNPFQLICEQHDKRLISDNQLIERWQDIVLFELNSLNEEIGIDWEKEAELTADPDYKPPSERSGLLQKGWEKINDWILEKSVQLVDLARRAGMAALKSIGWLIRKVQGFCGSHPTVCKVATMTLTVVAFYIAFAVLFENEAQAKLTYGGKPVSDNIVDGMKGQLVDIIDIRQEKGKTPTHLYKLLASIDDLHQAKGKHDFMNSKEGIDKGLNVLYDGLKDVVRGEDFAKDLPERDRVELLDRWIDIGARTEAWYREVTIKWEGNLQQTLDYGKSLAKKGTESSKEVYDVYKKTRRQ